MLIFLGRKRVTDEAFPVTLPSSTGIDKEELLTVLCEGSIPVTQNRNANHNAQGLNTKEHRHDGPRSGRSGLDAIKCDQNADVSG